MVTHHSEAMFFQENKSHSTRSLLTLFNRTEQKILHVNYSFIHSWEIKKYIYIYIHIKIDVLNIFLVLLHGVTHTKLGPLGPEVILLTVFGLHLVVGVLFFSQSTSMRNYSYLFVIYLRRTKLVCRSYHIFVGMNIILVSNSFSDREHSVTLKIRE